MLLLTVILMVVGAILVLVFVLQLARQPGAKVNAGAQEFSVGRAVVFAANVAANGPLIFPPLRGSITLYVQHLGADPMHGWLAFNAHDPDQPAHCFAIWHPATNNFVDPCDGATFPADGQGLDQYTVSIDNTGDVLVNLRQSVGTTPPTSAPPATAVATTAAPATTTLPASVPTTQP